MTWPALYTPSGYMPVRRTGRLVIYYPHAIAFITALVFTVLSSGPIRDRHPPLKVRVPWADLVPPFPPRDGYRLLYSNEKRARERIAVIREQQRVT